MKHLTTLIFLALLPFMAYAQTADITESLRMLDNSQADVMYDNEFGSFRNPDLDDPFPYVVIKVELSGDVAQAKRMLSLDLGTMYKVEARNTNKDNMILFLIRSSARSIHLVCGDGCDRQELYYGTLIMNKVYSCKVNYSAKKQTAAASNDEMAEMKKQVAEMQKQNEHMQQMLLSISQNQQQTTTPSATTPVSTTKTTQYPGVIIENGVLRRVPEDFKGHFVISSDITSIGGSAFSYCISLTSVTIPNSVKSIENGAFFGCTGLTSVTIPNSVTTIGDFSFLKCSGLTNVTIPNSVTSIGEGAFWSCTGLTSVTIPNSVTSIGVCAFRGCTELTNVTIPNSVKSIGKGAFWSCTGLTSVTIPNSVTSIGRYAFIYCTNLTSVTIKGSSTKIGDEDKDVFQNCPNLQAIYVPAGTKKYYQKMLPSKLKKLVIEQ